MCECTYDFLCQECELNPSGAMLLELAREREEDERVEKYEREKWLRNNTSQGGAPFTH